MPSHSTDPRYCEPNSDLIAYNGASDPVQIATGIPASAGASLYSITGNDILLCQNTFIGQPSIFDTSASGGRVDLLIDLQSAQDEADIIAFFNINARSFIVHYNDTDTTIDPSDANDLPGINANWAWYGPIYMSSYNTEATWRRYPHQYILPSGATPSGIRFLYIILDTPFYTPWSSTSIHFIGRIWCGPLKQMSAAGGVWEPQLPIDQETAYLTEQRRTQYGQTWSYKRNVERTYASSLKDCDRTARIAMERLYSMAYGSHYWWPYIPEYKMPIDSPAENREIWPVRFTRPLELKQKMVAWNAAETMMQEQNTIKFQLREEPNGLIDLG